MYKRTFDIIVRSASDCWLMEQLLASHDDYTTKFDMLRYNLKHEIDESICIHVFRERGRDAIDYRFLVTMESTSDTIMKVKILKDEVRRYFRYFFNHCQHTDW